jgi:TRAP transporter TAXI family solute receptor
MIKSLLIAFLGFVIIVSFVLFGVKLCSAGQIGISTGPTNLAYYAVGNDIKNTCPQLNINIYESKGGLSNIGNMFTRNDIQFGIAPLDTMKFKEITDKGKMSKIVVLMPLYKNAIQVIANNRSGIKKLEDLRGKRVNIGPVGSGSWVSAQLIQIRTGVKFVESTYSTADSLKKVNSGDLDAAFYFSGVPTPDLVALGKDGDGLIHLVNMRHPNLDNFYEPTEIPENTYAWEHNAVQIQQVQNYLIAYNYSSAEKQTDVANLVECIKMNLPKLQEEGNLVWRGVDLGAEVKWPMHEIARRILNR